MIYFKKERYDYFLICGHILKYRNEIINTIRANRYIKLLKILDHRPKSITRLVNTIYSSDYAPFEHLKTKMEYLLKNNRNVLFIFVHNKNAQEVWHNHGSYQHLERKLMNSIQEKICNKFVSRKDANCTEEYIVYTSCNESQVDHILKYLGVKDGIGSFRNVPNPLLSPPYYITKFDKFTIRCVNSSQIYCNILRGTKESFWTEALHIEETPHLACLTGDMRSYEEYLSRFLGGPLTCDYSVENLLRFSQNFVYLKPPYATSYILTKKFKPNQYLILDGVHRASILKSRGINNFPVAVIK